MRKIIKIKIKSKSKSKNKKMKTIKKMRKLSKNEKKHSK